jgi:hypothetical protein
MGPLCLNYFIKLSYLVAELAMSACVFLAKLLPNYPTYSWAYDPIAYSESYFLATLIS